MKNPLPALALSLLATVPALSAPTGAWAHPRHRVHHARTCEHVRRVHGNRGAVIGAVVGGLLGNRIAGRGSRTGGTIVGAGVGAVAGHEIGRSRVHCR